VIHRVHIDASAKGAVFLALFAHGTASQVNKTPSVTISTRDRNYPRFSNRFTRVYAYVCVRAIRVLGMCVIYPRQTEKFIRSFIARQSFPFLFFRCCHARDVSR